MERIHEEKALPNEKAKMNQIVCELCFPNAIEVGEIFPHAQLVIDGDKYFIMTQDGHKGHELLYFPDKPTPDTDPGTDDWESTDKDMAWVDKVDDWSRDFKPYPEDGWFLVDGCKKAGWKGAPRLLFWLYDRAGKMIKEHESGSKPD